MKTLVQCDFDGTITVEDEAFLLLEDFAAGDWRSLLADYQEGRISVGDFNSGAFAMVKADRQMLYDSARRTLRARPGFDALVARCRQRGDKLAIVSNGLDFYIEAFLQDAGVSDVEVYAAKTSFHTGGIDVRYMGPDGNEVRDGFKETYTRLFLSQCYHVVYVGNGPSDVPPARLSHRVFATGELLAICGQINLSCTPFTDLNDVVRGLED